MGKSERIIEVVLSDDCYECPVHIKTNPTRRGFAYGLSKDTNMCGWANFGHGFWGYNYEPENIIDISTLALEGNYWYKGDIEKIRREWFILGLELYVKPSWNFRRKMWINGTLQRYHMNTHTCDGNKIRFILPVYRDWGYYQVGDFKYFSLNIAKEVPYRKCAMYDKVFHTIQESFSEDTNTHLMKCTLEFTDRKIVSDIPVGDYMNIWVTKG